MAAAEIHAANAHPRRRGVRAVREAGSGKNTKAQRCSCSGAEALRHLRSMRITIRSTCKRDVVEAFAADPANAPLVDADSLSISDLDATSPAFDRLLEAARGRSRCWFHAWMEFDAAEIGSCRFL